MSDINALIAEMRAGLDGVTPGFPLWIWLLGDRTVYTRDPSDGCRISAVVRADCIGQNNGALAHIARCSPGNIARLLDHIEALRIQLKETLHRETATTARYDARIAELEAKLKAVDFVAKRAFSELTKATSTIGALDAENARLREALRPFSVMAGPLFMANYNDNDVLFDPNLTCESGTKPRLTFGDFRRAREALKESKP